MNINVHDHITMLTEVCQSYGQKSAVEFKHIFSKASEISLNLDFELKCPRIVSRQMYKANHPNKETQMQS